MFLFTQQEDVFMFSETMKTSKINETHRQAILII